MKICILIVLFLTASISQAQKPTATPHSGETVEKRMARVKEAAAQAEKEFYSQPPIVRVSFFIDDREVPLNGDFSFKLFINAVEVQPASVDGSRFLFPPISEPFSVTFEKGDHQLRFDDLPANWLKHGAEVVYGVITKFDLLKTEAPFYGTFDSEYPKRNAYREGRRQVSTEEFTGALDRKNTKNIVFFVLQPRVYGDGVVSVTTQVHRKNRKR